MIGIGAYNQLIIHKDSLKMLAVAPIIGGTEEPRGNMTSSRKGEDSNSLDVNKLISKFGKSTKAEAFIGIALLAAVGVLVNTGLPASEFQSQIQQLQQQQLQSIPGLNLANGVTAPAATSATIRTTCTTPSIPAATRSRTRSPEPVSRT